MIDLIEDRKKLVRRSIFGDKVTGAGRRDLLLSTSIQISVGGRAYFLGNICAGLFEAGTDLEVFVGATTSFDCGLDSRSWIVRSGDQALLDRQSLQPGHGWLRPDRCPNGQKVHVEQGCSQEAGGGFLFLDWSIVREHLLFRNIRVDTR